ncbi:hypothetical protein MNEG_7326 [Monoraphidium neglectum]|uniref:Uncharacterized protein n=1 Tax=Monoraphidium neglectum TaxID=145388 RepID=A0A0D2MJ50_9CHLO|nr:hypothetical protein MNEG_7326 [Monoraphidium neglectum]KIZ00637.1 hypothetical protein MNEG_7326 [Monoraphidium neglectum]|eukprot:XP_013899656.1 hypothetical protein MNEG_7326 [Monoraphidium neglectum]
MVEPHLSSGTTPQPGGRWWSVVPSARRTLAKEKRAGAVRGYLEEIQNDSDRGLERWFYTDWLRQLERRQEMARNAAAKRAAALGGGAAAGGGGAEGGTDAEQQRQQQQQKQEQQQQEDDGDRQPAFFSLDNPLIATAALVAGAGAASALLRAVAGAVAGVMQ